MQIKVGVGVCPFCGQRAGGVGGAGDGSVVVKEVRKNGYGNYQVICNYLKGGCGASGGFGRSAEDAWRKWNVRKGVWDGEGDSKVAGDNIRSCTADM